MECPYPYTIHMDHKKLLDGVWGGANTTFAVNAAWPDGTFDLVVKGPNWATGEPGEAYTATHASGVVTVAGVNLDSASSTKKCVVGQLFREFETLSRPYRRDRNGAAIVGQTDDVRRLVVVHGEVGYMQASTVMDNRPTRTASLGSVAATIDSIENPGEFEALFNGFADEQAITLESTDHRPSFITGYRFDMLYEDTWREVG